MECSSWQGGERVSYRQPTGPNPLNHRDEFSRPALRHGSLNAHLAGDYTIYCANKNPGGFAPPGKKPRDLWPPGAGDKSPGDKSPQRQVSPRALGEEVTSPGTASRKRALGEEVTSPQTASRKRPFEIAPVILHGDVSPEQGGAGGARPVHQTPETASRQGGLGGAVTLEVPDGGRLLDFFSDPSVGNKIKASEPLAEVRRTSGIY